MVARTCSLDCRPRPRRRSLLELRQDAHRLPRYLGLLNVINSSTRTQTHISLSFDKIPRHPPQVIMPLTALTTAPRLCDPAFQSFAVVDE